MGFLLRHGEKIAISLVGLIALWLIYKTTSLPRLADQFQAPKLQEEIRQTSSAVRDATWPEKGSESAGEVRPYEPIEAKADNTVADRSLQDFAPRLRYNDRRADRPPHRSGAVERGRCPCQWRFGSVCIYR